MASDFPVAWQFSQKEPLFFVTDQSPCPHQTRSLPAQI
jgi:hypothetical protein